MQFSPPVLLRELPHASMEKERAVKVARVAKVQDIMTLMTTTTKVTTNRCMEGTKKIDIIFILFISLRITVRQKNAYLNLMVKVRMQRRTGCRGWTMTTSCHLFAL